MFSRRSTSVVDDEPVDTRVHHATVAAKLIKRGFEVYEPVVNVHGVNFIVRLRSGAFLEICVASFVKTANSEILRFEARESPAILKERPYFVVGVGLSGDLWIIPSKVLFDPAITTVEITEAGMTSVLLNLSEQRVNDVMNYERLGHLRNNWQLLADASLPPGGKWSQTEN